MSNSLQIFSYSTQTVRIQMINDQPWFCLRDVCSILTLGNITKVKNQLDDKGCTKSKAPTNSYEQQLWFINEPNLYRVIFRSNKPNAKHFQDWVFNEVLPQIRRTGSYSITDQPKPKRASREDMIKFKQAIDHLCRFCFRAEGSAKHAIYGIFREELNLNNFSELRADQVEKAQQILMEIMDYSKLYSDCVRMFEQTYIEQGLRGKNPLGSITLMIDEHTYQGVKAKTLSQMYR